MDQFKWKRRATSGPLDLCKVTKWTCEAKIKPFFCNSCSRFIPKRLDVVYTVVAQWTDTGLYEKSLGMLCEGCVVKLMGLSRNTSRMTLEELIGMDKKTA